MLVPLAEGHNNLTLIYLLLLEEAALVGVDLYLQILLFAADQLGQGCFSHLFAREEVRIDFDWMQDCYGRQVADCFLLLLAWEKFDWTLEICRGLS